MFGEGQSRSYRKDKSTESSSCFYFEGLKLHKSSAAGLKVGLAAMLHWPVFPPG